MAVQAEIASHLEERRQSLIRQHQTLAIIQVIGSVILFKATTYFIATFLSLLMVFTLGFSYTTCVILSALFLAGLCFLHTRLYSPDDDFLKQASDSPFAMIEIIVRVILFGIPTLFRSGTRNYRKSMRLVTVDFDSCAHILAHLLEHDRGIPIEVLDEELPFLDIRAHLDDLLLIDGVLHLKREPDSLAVADDLRRELEALGA